MAIRSLRAGVALLSALTLAAIIFAAPALAQEGKASSGVLRSAILLLWAQVLLLSRSEMGLLSSLVTKFQEKALKVRTAASKRDIRWIFPDVWTSIIAASDE
jgi:apolipoprotein N-acyltransferase